MDIRQMGTIPLLLLACLLATTSALGTQDCTKEAFETAQKAFTDRLGLSSDDYNWKDAEKFARKIFDLYGLGTLSVGGRNAESSFVVVCKAHERLMQALSDADVNWNTCFRQVFMLQNDVDPVNGKVFSGVFNLIRSQCGALFYPIVNNWDNCVSRVYNVSGGASCLKWTPEIQGQQAVCRSTTDSSTCLQKAFNDVCGTPESNYIACETISAFFSGLYPLCVDQCKGDF
ncbi:hypothetical protein Ddc_13218 [Ditylenchus destructor]|nr:hypothetical protein Ddc_13218 [Ditylenchus destructor]